MTIYNWIYFQNVVIPMASFWGLTMGITGYLRWKHEEMDDMLYVIQFIVSLVFLASLSLILPWFLTMPLVAGTLDLLRSTEESFLRKKIQPLAKKLGRKIRHLRGKIFPKVAPEPVPVPVRVRKQ